MDCNFPFLIRRYSTFRNDLPFLVWQRYFTKASSAPVVIRSRSKCPMKSICVSQHRALKVLLLMWSSPAALVKGEVIGEQAKQHWPPVFLLPGCVPLPGYLLVRQVLPSQCAGTCPSPAGSRHQPARKLPLRADSCATLRSLSLCVLLFMM